MTKHFTDAYVNRLIGDMEKLPPPANIQEIVKALGHNLGRWNVSNGRFIVLMHMARNEQWVKFITPDIVQTLVRTSTCRQGAALVLRDLSRSATGAALLDEQKAVEVFLQRILSGKKHLFESDGVLESMSGSDYSLPLLRKSQASEKLQAAFFDKAKPNDIRLGCASILGTFLSARGAEFLPPDIVPRITAEFRDAANSAVVRKACVQILEKYTENSAGLYDQDAVSALASGLEFPPGDSVWDPESEIPEACAYAMKSIAENGGAALFAPASIAALRAGAVTIENGYTRSACRETLAILDRPQPPTATPATGLNC